jgi:Ca2+-binding EF-hand superfamily protein
VVVENFSYVIRLTGPTSVTREEMRAFKKVWAEFDPDTKGYIQRADFVRFFAVR